MNKYQEEYCLKNGLVSINAENTTLSEYIEHLENKLEQAEQLNLTDVVGRSEQLVCDCPNEEWVYDESGVDMYCKKCEPKK